MQTVVRPIDQRDYASVIEVIKLAIRISQGKIYPAKLLEEFCKKYTLENFRIKAQEVEYFVAEDTTSKKILGVIGLKDNHLRTFFVDPHYQGLGIGRKLYTYLESKARERNVQELFLKGSPLGEPVYLHFGFRKIKEVKTERAGIQYTDAYMVKKLLYS